MIKALLMDLDNTLVNAAEWHYVSLNRALKKVAGIEINYDEHISIFNGLPTKKKLEKLTELGRVDKLAHTQIYNLKQEYTKEVIKELAKPDQIKIKFHKYNRWNNLKTCCVTNSITETAILMLEYTGQLEFMDFVISNECVRNPKPIAEGFICAMVRYGFYPQECIIVEDSPIGIQCALTTGANVWKIKDSNEVTIENFQQYMVDLNTGKFNAK